MDRYPGYPTLLARLELKKAQAKSQLAQNGQSHLVVDDLVGFVMEQVNECIQNRIGEDRVPPEPSPPSPTGDGVSNVTNELPQQQHRNSPLQSATTDNEGNFDNCEQLPREENQSTPLLSSLQSTNIINIHIKQELLNLETGLPITQKIDRDQTNICTPNIIDSVGANQTVIQTVETEFEPSTSSSNQNQDQDYNVKEELIKEKIVEHVEDCTIDRSFGEYGKEKKEWDREDEQKNIERPVKRLRMDYRVYGTVSLSSRNFESSRDGLEDDKQNRDLSLNDLKKDDGNVDTNKEDTKVEEESYQRDEHEMDTIQYRENAANRVPTANNFVKQIPPDEFQNTFECDYEQCGKRFKHKGNLLRHIQSHLGVKPWRCPWTDCGRAFVQKTTLNVHYRIHTKERPFACDQCEATFVQKANLNAHLRTHTTVRRFVCDQCGATFAWQYILVTHLTTHSTDQLFVCETPGCTKTYKTMANLRRHRDSTHN